MSQAGEELNQEINLNITGAEKVAGATALLTDLSGALQQLLSNPLGGSYAMNRIAHGLETAFVDPMKKSVNLTKVQQLEFDKLVAKSRGILTTIGFISGLSLGMTELIRKTKLASSELGQFMSLSQLPGGAEDFYSAQLYMQENFIEKSLQYNEQYSREYEQIYKELRRKILADIVPPGTSREDAKQLIEDAEPQIKALIEQLTTLQTGTGVSLLGFSNLRDHLKSFGYDIKDVTQLYKILTSEIIAGEEFEGFTPRELFETFVPAILNRGGTHPTEAISQVLTLMQTYSDQAGPEQIQQLLRIIPSFQNELETNVLARNLLPGITKESMTGPGGAVNIIEALRGRVQEITKNLTREGKESTPRNIMEIWAQSPSGVALLEKMGINKDILQLINSLEEVDGLSTSVIDQFKEWRIDKNILSDTDLMKKAIVEINKGLKGSSDIFTTMADSFKWLTTQMQKGFKDIGLDIEPRIIQAGILGVTGLAAYKYGPRMLRSFLSKSGIIGGATIPAKLPISGAGFVPWGTETAAVTTGKVGSKLGKFGKFGGKLAKGLGIGGAIVSEAIDAYEDVSKYVEEGKGFGEVTGRQTIKAMYKYNPITMGLNIGKAFSDIFKGENIFDAFFNADVIKDMQDVVFKGTKDVTPEKLLAMMPAHVPFGTEEVKEKIDKDLPNLNIIIYNADGDVLASETLQDAVRQGAISIVMEGIVGVK